MMQHVLNVQDNDTVLLVYKSKARVIPISRIFRNSQANSRKLNLLARAYRTGTWTNGGTISQSTVLSKFKAMGKIDASSLTDTGRDSYNFLLEMSDVRK